MNLLVKLVEKVEDLELRRVSHKQLADIGDIINRIRPGARPSASTQPWHLGISFGTGSAKSLLNLKWSWSWS